MPFEKSFVILFKRNSYANNKAANNKAVISKGKGLYKEHKDKTKDVMGIESKV